MGKRFHSISTMQLNGGKTIIDDQYFGPRFPSEVQHTTVPDFLALLAIDISKDFD